MAVDTTQVIAIANRLRRHTINKEVLDLCDFILARTPHTGCPVCEARRVKKAATMRRYRGRQKENGNAD